MSIIQLNQRLKRWGQLIFVGLLPILFFIFTPTSPTTAEPAVPQNLASASYFKASNTNVNDEFGRVIALDGDTLVVGAYAEDSDATGVNGDQNNNDSPNSGAVYIFVRTNGLWSQQAYLKASNTGPDDLFGWSVAISGDTLVVGAYLEDSNAVGVNGDQSNNSATDSGAAYVFTRTNGVWSQQAYLKASNTESQDQFGYAVAIAGDTIVVGANLEDSSATGVNGNQSDNSSLVAGAAYVFTRTAGVWSQQAYLKASNTDAFDRFGGAVAISGDTAVVTAPYESSNAVGVGGNQADNSASEAGAAYVFTRTAGVWSQQAYLKASNTESTDNFGYSLAIDNNTIVLGAINEDSNATGVNGNQADNSAAFAGSAYVFTRTAGVWSQQAYLKASNTEANDVFSIGLDISGDTIVVGGYLEDSNAVGVNGNQSDNSLANAGAAYLFTRTAGVWSQQAYLKASNTGANDLLGRSVSISGDIIVAGASLEDSNATGVNGDQSNNSMANSGAVYSFEQTYPLTVTTSGSGGGLVQSTPAGITCGADCEETFFAGQVITLTAIAEVGSMFSGWSGTVNGMANPITVTIDMSHTVTATFTLSQYPITITTAGNGSGQVTSDPAGPLFDYGSVVTLTAAADTGSTFTGWSGDVTDTTNPVTLTIGFEQSVTATFTLNQYPLTLATAGNGSGQVTSDPAGPLFDYGSVVTLTAAADTGSTFTGWSGAITGTANPITLTMGLSDTVTATFTLDEETEYWLYLPVINRPAAGDTVLNGLSQYFMRALPYFK